MYSVKKNLQKKKKTSSKEDKEEKDDEISIDFSKIKNIKKYI